MKVTAIVTVWNKEEKKEDTRGKIFEVEMRDEGKLYSEELVDWVEEQKDRVSNLFTIVFNGKEYKYSL